MGNTAVTVWDIAKWPVLLLIVSLMFAILYYAVAQREAARLPLGHPRRPPRGASLWIVASAAFAFYVANFGSYNKTYGALGGVIDLPGLAVDLEHRVLLGAELNAELERGRRIEAGHPADVEPFVEPRDTRKFSDRQKQEVNQ